MRLPLALLVTALAAQPAAAGGLQDLAAIDRAVAGFAGAPIGQPGGAQTPVDRQLRLADCASPLALDWHGQARTAVRVSCEDQGGWRIFVPVMTGHRAAEAAPVVSRRDLLRVEAGGGGFRVSSQGEALEDGRAGESIRVRIADGTRQGRIVSARVLEAGRVMVPIR